MFSKDSFLAKTEGAILIAQGLWEWEKSIWSLCPGLSSMISVFFSPSLIGCYTEYPRSSLVTQLVKSLSATWETQVQSLSREDPLEREMATHSSILAWRIPWTEEPGRLQSMGSQRAGRGWVTDTFTFTEYPGASLVAQMAKNLPAMQETQVWSLGGEDPLEKRMATHSSILAWEMLWTEESGGLQSIGSQRVRHNWVTNTFTFQERQESLI